MNDIRFNVFCVSEQTSEIFPCYISKKKYDRTCNLLLIEEDDKSHYVWIKNVNRLMNTQSKHNNRKFFCYCLQHFTSEKILGEHKEVCLKVNGMQKVKLPKSTHISFTNYHKQLPALFVIYAYFECLTVPISEKCGNNTEAYQAHKACGYGCEMVCSYDDKYNKPTKIYRGPGAVYTLFENLLDEEKDLCKIIKNEFKIKMIITKYEEIRFKNAGVCHICN